MYIWQWVWQMIEIIIYKNKFNTGSREIQMIWLMGGNNLRYLKYCTGTRSFIVLVKKLSINTCLILVITGNKRTFIEPQKTKKKWSINHCTIAAMCFVCSVWIESSHVMRNTLLSFQSQWSSVQWKHTQQYSNNLPQNRCYINFRTKQSLYSRQDFSTWKQTAAAACSIKGGVSQSCTDLFSCGRNSQQV